MKAIKQYTDFYDEHSAAICANAPALFNARRQQARSALESAVLPDKGDEKHPALSLNAMFAPDYGININRVEFPADTAAAFHCGVPNISTLLALVVNDTFRHTPSLLRNMPQGVSVMSLAKAAADKPEFIASHLGALSPADNPAVALNDMLLQDGVLVHIARGTRLQKPLQLVNIFNSASPLMGVRRLLVVVDDDAEASMLVCDHSELDSVDYLANQVTEIFVGNNSRFELYDLEESSARTRRVSHLYARQQADSRLVVNGTTLIGGETANNYHVEVVGDNAFTRLAGMAIASDSQTTDNVTYIHHASRHCQSDQMFKYVLDDSAVGSFYGTIVVDEDAVHTNANQSNRNIVANADARMYTRPQLEIYCDDVKCSHGATVGQLDAQALFYMQSRGIPRNEARMMLMQAFMADVIDTVDIPALRSRLQQLVENRLSGNRTLCADCPQSQH